MAPARVAITDCIISRPLSSSTATEIVSRWTSIPIYLTLFIRVFLSLRFGCCFSHQPQLTSKGAPFYNACPYGRGQNVDAKLLKRRRISLFYTDDNSQYETDMRLLSRFQPDIDNKRLTKWHVY